MMDLVRKIRAKSARNSIDGAHSPTGEDVVRVTTEGLIRLNDSAVSLCLESSAIRAQRSGPYLSAFKGRGMEFDEARLYQPGDDIRNLDWRVTARTGKPHTKLFREERERPVFIWVDYRAPMFFATRGVYKAVFAANAAGILAWSASQHGDRVGGVIFSENVHHEIKPQRGKSAVLRLIKQLVEHPAWESTQSASEDNSAAQHAMARLPRLVRPGSLIFLVSDFRRFNKKAESHLSQVARHNDVVMVFIHDPLESGLPPAGHYRLSDGCKEITMNTRDLELTRAYRNRFDNHVGRLETLARQHHAYLLACCTNQDPFCSLQRGLGLKRA